MTDEDVDAYLMGWLLIGNPCDPGATVLDLDASGELVESGA